MRNGDKFITAACAPRQYETSTESELTEHTYINIYTCIYRYIYDIRINKNKNVQIAVIKKILQIQNANGYANTDTLASLFFAVEGCGLETHTRTSEYTPRDMVHFVYIHLFIREI